MKKRIYVDMDNTLCDYSGRKAEVIRQNENMIYPQAQYGFFANLDPLPGAIKAFRKLEEFFEVYILTAPSYKNPLCYTEKRVWVEKHFDIETTRKLIICARKGLLKGDYLIDDFDYPEFEGEQIKYGSDPFNSWNDVLNYLLPIKVKDVQL